MLIGAETSDRRWVSYEIKRSSDEKMGILGIYIHNMKDRNALTDTKGANPLSGWKYKYNNGTEKSFSDIYKTYDWVNDDGYNNFGTWVEEAAKNAGR